MVGPNPIARTRKSPVHGNSYFAGAIVLTLACVFVLLGVCLIPYPGLQNDEVLFGDGIFAPRQTLYWTSVFKKPVPLMLMSYLGTLKAWIYTPILALWKPGAWSVRLPVLLLGGVTIWMFFLLLRRVLDSRSAAIGCALLATDTTYLLTTCFDWGPVALQHALSIGGVLLLVRFHQTLSRICLGGAFFLFGLALWDKALFGWILIAMAAGAACAFPGILRRAFNRRNAAICVLCFLASAYPLIRYNLRYPLETLRNNAGWSTEKLDAKRAVLSSSLAGDGLLGYLTCRVPSDSARHPRTALERFSVFLGGLAGTPRGGWMAYGLAASLLMMPFLWRTPARPPLVFAFVLLLVGWCQMLFGKGVGGSAHHVVLLWPWPHFLVAAAWGRLSQDWNRIGRFTIVGVVALICGRGVLVTNVYLSQLIQYGGAGPWTDAIYDLSDRLPSDGAKQVVVLDWGILQPLRLLHRGRLPLIWGTNCLRTNPPSAEDFRNFRQLMVLPDPVFVAHTNGHEQFAGVNARFDEMLQKARYRKETVQIVTDRNGRLTFEVFRVGQTPSKLRSFDQKGNVSPPFHLFAPEPEDAAKIDRLYCGIHGGSKVRRGSLQRKDNRRSCDEHRA
jgi:hypothetical protein